MCPVWLSHQAYSEHVAQISSQAPTQSCTCHESLGLFLNTQKLHECTGSSEILLA